MKQWKRLAALSSAIVMAAATLTYFPNDTLQNIRLEISASAETTTEPQVWIEDNLTWTLDADGTLTISGTGAMKDYDNGDNPSPVYNNSDVKKIVIEDGVTSIGVAAFYNCSNLTSITIPDSVIGIGAYAFSGCEGLTSITIPDSVTSIGNSAFSYCISLTSITIPKSVTSIELAAFYNCSSLTSITIPDSVTSIGRSAFYKCSSLTSITIPDSVTSIGETVFGDCSSLKTISLSCKSTLKKSNFGGQANLVSASHTLKKTEAKDATCTEDGNKEYWTCEHCGKYFLSDDTNPETAKAVELSETVIPASHKLTKVEAKDATCTEDGNKEYWTCEHCGKYFLSDDTNPETAKAVEQSETILPAIQHKNAELRNASEPTETAPGYSGDRYCPDCDKVVEKGYTYWNEDNLTWKLDADGTLTISGTGAMKDYNDDDNPSPVYQNSNVKKVVIEKGVTSIGNYAFSGCLGLKSITIPDGITSIGNHAFDSCINLRSITLPDSITSIGMWAFYNCWNVSSIIIPDGVTSIEDFTFNSCISLTSITIPNSVTNIKSSAFHNCADLTSITIPDSVTSIGYAAFSNCDSLQTISLGCGSALKKSDFGDQANLVSYTNQHLLTKTEAKAKTCTEDGNKEYWTCEHCGKYFLSDDTNPETAKAVEQSEFIIPASHKLTKVEAKDATCTEDGNKAYWTCEHCGKYFLSDDSNPETAKAVEQSETVIPALKHKNATTRGAVKPTKTAPGYSGDRYCPDCDKVVEKGYTYWIEDNLTWKLYEDGTLNISGTGAMKDYNADDNPSPAYNNSKVKKIVIEKGVTSVGDYAFRSCNNLTSIMISNSVTSIGNSAFFYCTSLTSVTIPDNVTSIENYAFAYTGLKSITIPDSVTNIGNYAFAGCKDLTSITIPDSVTSIGNSAFYNCSSLTSTTIPDSVTSIGTATFSGCKNLTSITIPDSVTSIGNSAFVGCKNLTSITIPDSVTSIGESTFKYCSNLKTISLSCKSSLKRNDFGEQADLVSYTNQHLLTKTEAKAATCTEDGNKEYWTCEHCGKYFLSDDANPATATAVELSETVIPASHKLTKVEAKDATCTEDGNKAYWTCEHCKKYFLSDDTNPETAKAVEQAETVIPASHKLTKVEAKAATCTEDGNKEYWTCEHCKKYFLSDDTNPATAKAVELSETVIPASHKLTKVEAKAATCTEDGNIEYWTCEHCKKYFLSDDTNPETAKAVEQSETVISASHKLTKVEAKAATCTEDGNKEYWTCEHCKKYFLSDDTNPETAKAVEQSETVISASHKLTKVEAKAATCTEDGNIEYWTCEHCKKYFLSDDTNPETAKAVELSETVIPALVQVATATTPIKCVYGQDMSKIDLRDYVKNTDVVGEVTVKVATGSTLPDGMKLDGSKLSGKPAKAYEDGKEVTFTFTAENGSTANLTLLFLVEKADPTVEVSVSGDSHTEGDLVSELKLILSENSTKGVVELVSEIKALVAGKNTFTWKFTPEDENNYNMVTGTVVVNAQTTTTTTTTKATTTTTKATTTTKPSKTTTTNATTTTKPSKTTTTNATTTTKPSKTTTTNATTTTKPSKTTTTKATTTTKPSKMTTTKATTTTKPSKTTTTKVTTTTKQTTTTNATTTNTAIPSYGDVNLDGKVDIVDAIFLNKYLATLIQFSDAQVANADCCQDGVLNDQDTTALMQFIILLIDDLPVQPTEK